MKDWSKGTKLAVIGGLLTLLFGVCALSVALDPERAGRQEAASARAEFEREYYSNDFIVTFMGGVDNPITLGDCKQIMHLYTGFERGTYSAEYVNDRYLDFGIVTEQDGRKVGDRCGRALINRGISIQ